eukprot:779640-Pelagomonas_calceolata.AAC.1
MDVGSADRLAQHDLHITEQVSNRVIPPYLYDPSIQGGYKGKRPRSRRLTASLFIITHEVMKKEG